LIHAAFEKRAQVAAQVADTTPERLFWKEGVLACLLLARQRAFQRTLIGSAFFWGARLPEDSMCWKLIRNSGLCAALFTGSRPGKWEQDHAMTRNST
jgi:hypothetical protein